MMKQKALTFTSIFNSAIIGQRGLLIVSRFFLNPRYPFRQQFRWRKELFLLSSYNIHLHINI